MILRSDFNFICFNISVIESFTSIAFTSFKGVIALSIVLDMNFVDDFTDTFFVIIPFFCSLDVESIVRTFESGKYFISIPYTSSNSVIGIYIVPFLFSRAL